MRQPWKNRYIENAMHSTRTNFHMEFRSKDEFFSFVCRMLAVLLQHGLGGLLCIPAVLGFEGPAAAAARHGALSEAGWELSDTIQRLWQVTLGSARDRAENP